MIECKIISRRPPKTVLSCECGRPSPSCSRSHCLCKQRCLVVFHRKLFCKGSSGNLKSRRWLQAKTVGTNKVIQKLQKPCMIYFVGTCQLGGKHSLDLTWKMFCIWWSVVVQLGSHLLVKWICFTKNINTNVQWTQFPNLLK